MALRSHPFCSLSLYWLRRSLRPEEEGYVDDVRRAEENVSQSTGTRAGYAEWIALGAVVAGSVGAIVGAARCSHRGSRYEQASSRPESASLTAPHGDKLSSVV